QRGGDYGWFCSTLACGVSQWPRLWTWWRLNLSPRCAGGRLVLCSGRYMGPP
ncbi:hypothetical protein WMY93_018413, partial [Mugilogobius chulae]